MLIISISPLLVFAAGLSRLIASRARQSVVRSVRASLVAAQIADNERANKLLGCAHRRFIHCGSAIMPTPGAAALTIIARTPARQDHRRLLYCALRFGRLTGRMPDMPCCFDSKRG
jgi:hypothetical protein